MATTITREDIAEIYDALSDRVLDQWIKHQPVDGPDALAEAEKAMTGERKWAKRASDVRDINKLDKMQGQRSADYALAASARRS